MLNFLSANDAMGNRTDVVNVSNSRHAVVLVAGVPKQVAVPTGARIVLANANGDFWMQYGAAAALPAGDVLNGAAAELNPAGRIINGVTALGLVAPTDCTVSLAFYG